MDKLDKEILKQEEQTMQLLYRTGTWTRLTWIAIIRGIGYGIGLVLFWGTLILIIILLTITVRSF